MTRKQVAMLQQLLSGGLYTNGDDGIRIKDAAVRVAAAQARAIRFALMCDNESEMPPYEDGRQGWCAGDDRFDRNDAFIALGGVVALLDASATLAFDADHLASVYEKLDNTDQSASEEAAE